MKVTAIVPVLNEGKTIRGVLEAITKSRLIDNVIVVDGGSKDESRQVINKFKLKKLKSVMLPRPQGGKGGAISIATEKIDSDVIFFCDADLVGLKQYHIKQIINPVLKGEATMSIGLRDKRSFIGNLIMPYFPLTGGQRAILTKVFMEIRKCPLIEGWGLESVMNDYCKKKKLKVAKVKLDGMDHIGIQAKKYGLMAFVRQIYDAILTRIKLLGVKYD